MTRAKNDNLQGALVLLVLKSLEQERWIASEWGVSENNRRARFYKLTALGRKQLASERENWQRITDAVGLVLGFGEA